MTTLAPFSSTVVVICPHKATRLIRQDLSLVKLCQLPQITSLFSMCLNLVPRRICSMISQAQRRGWQVFPGFPGFLGSSFLHFLKMSGIFSCFQLPWTLPVCHDFSNIMESGLATTLVTSLRTLGYISLGSIDSVYQIPQVVRNLIFFYSI